MRGAILHIIGDLVQSIGVAAAGALIWWKQVNPLQPTRKQAQTAPPPVASDCKRSRLYIAGGLPERPSSPSDLEKGTASEIPS